jgi:two-component system chemotaxis response regulator CheB
MSALEQKKVLVVDDSALMRRLISEIVETDPDLRVVDVAENGRVALQKVRQHRPDCVLLDIEMPELSGLDALRRLRLRSSAKVVILSHLGPEGARVRAEALRLGAVAVIDKPTGAVSRDLRNTRGSIIRDTLRHALGLPAVPLPDGPLPAEGALVTVSILSVDVLHFGSLCECVEAPALVRLLNEHLALVGEVTRRHDGLIDAHVGGATLAVFGAPLRCVDYASRAVAAAGELLDAFAARDAQRRDAGEPLLEVGMAVVTGVVLAGKLGPPNGRRYRTTGNALELAPRLGRSTQGYGVGLIACGQTLAALASPIASRRLDVVEVESESEPITLYEVLSAGSVVASDALEAYARGLGHYEVGRFAQAIQAFDYALQLRPLDLAATRLRSRCQTLLRARPSAWRGVWPLDGTGG